MQYLTGEEEIKGIEYLINASKIALSSTCERSRCGSIIVNGDRVIGVGFNSPPGELESQRKCSYSKDAHHQKVTDKTCCVHAEQRAIFDALKNNPSLIFGSRLYFVRLNEEGKPSFAGEPYCTICSKMALDVGISEFVLWHEQGVAVYSTDEYNLLSYKFKG